MSTVAAAEPSSSPMTSNFISWEKHGNIYIYYLLYVEVKHSWIVLLPAVRSSQRHALLSSGPDAVHARPQHVA